MKANRSARAASKRSATFGSLSASASMIRSYWAPTDSASGWSNTECSRVRTPRPGRLRGDGHQVGRVVRSAALPGRPGQRGANRSDQTGVRVGVDQPHPGQAAGAQRPPEAQPAGPVLGGGHVQAQDFAVALGVDPGGDQSVHVDHPALLSDLEHQVLTVTHSATTRR